MSNNIPYHLKPNKTIDRNIFLEILERIQNYISLNDHTYIGLGGAFLEDFKILHKKLDITNMICLEKDYNTYHRQQFNKPINCIDFKYTTTKEFIDDFNFDEPAIIWLDYTSASDIKQQLDELHNICTQTQPNSIIKITINANPNTLGNLPSSEIDGMTKFQADQEQRKYRRQVLKERLDIYYPTETSIEMLQQSNYPEILKNAFQIVIDKASEFYRYHTFQPLSAATYKDSAHQMLTLTGIILENDQIQTFFEKTSLDKRIYSFTEWIQDLMSIDVPVLSALEYFSLNAMLPLCGTEEMRDSNLFYLGKRHIEHYLYYYRYYPIFSKIDL